jgi:hypothetical protein
MQRAKSMKRKDGAPYAHQAKSMMEGHADHEWKELMAECEESWKARERMEKAFDEPEFENR